MDAAKVIQTVRQYPYNKKCVDGDKDNPEWISTNNGVFICLVGGAKHRSLGAEISKIKSIMHGDWDRNELIALQTGGNKSFYEFMGAYDLNSMPIDQKYDSYACYYYRKMLNGYIDGSPICDLPPVKHIGRKIVSESMYRVNSQKNNELSPVRRDGSSADLTKSSITYRDQQLDQKHNNSMHRRQRMNYQDRKYESQNNLDELTFMINDKLSGKLANKYVCESIEIDTEDDSRDIDDDMGSDKDKYSAGYGSGLNQNDFKTLSEKGTSTRKNNKHDLEIEGPNNSINGGGGVFGTPNYDENNSILDKAIYYSMQLGSYATQGYNMIFGTPEVITFNDTSKNLTRNGKKKTDKENNCTLSNENTISTLPHSRKQSFVSRVNIHRKFYEN